MSLIAFTGLFTGQTKRLRLLKQEALQRLDRLNLAFGNKRPAATLLCIVEGRVIRADADATGNLLGEPVRLPLECHSLSNLPEVVAEALRGDERTGRKLWVLCDALPNYLVSAPMAQVAGLGKEQLSSALLFELEQLTGQSSSNQQSAQIVVGQSEGMNHYWLSHASRALTAQLSRTAKAQGSAFSGLLHPGGVPLSLATEPSGQGWARLEIWPDILIGRHGGGPGQLQTWILPADTKLRRIEGEIERWQASLGDQFQWEALGQGVALDFLPSKTVPINLEGDDAILRWLTGWGKTLAQAYVPDMPVLAPPEDPNREKWLMAAGGGAALLVCLIHAGMQYAHSKSSEEDRLFLKSSEGNLKSIETEIQKYQRQKDDYTKKHEPALTGRAAPTPEVLAALRTRLSALLREIAMHSTDGMVVEEIHTKTDAVTVKGVCLNPTEANRLAAYLQNGLRGLGWRVQPPKKKDLAMDATGGPWEFEIVLTDSGLAGFASPMPATPAASGLTK